MDRYYYDFQWQQTGGKEHPYIAEKTKIILDIIPSDVRTIADIGCGDGAITNVLAERYTITGVDLSQEAIRHLSTKVLPVVSNANNLPFEDRYADMVFSSELLEHLPDKVFLKAISEIKRISKKYILITVPNKEKLRKRFTKCNTCGFEFHIYRHLSSFNLRKLSQYFDGYAIKFSTVCGALDEKSFNIISYLKNKLANSYFFVTSVPILCPKCKTVLNFLFKRNFAQKLINFSLVKLQNMLNLLLNRKPEPDWLIVLFEKGRDED